jgi:hypothetical protein
MGVSSEPTVIRDVAGWVLFGPSKAGPPILSSPADASLGVEPQRGFSFRIWVGRMRFGRHRREAIGAGVCLARRCAGRALIVKRKRLMKG